MVSFVLDFLSVLQTKLSSFSSVLMVTDTRDRL
jgi:hypothetical protein